MNFKGTQFLFKFRINVLDLKKDIKYELIIIYTLVIYTRIYFIQSCFIRY